MEKCANHSPLTTKLFLFKQLTRPQHVLTESIHRRHYWPTARLHCTLEIILNHSTSTEHVPVTPHHFSPADLLTGAKHPAFSTNHLADIDKTKQNKNTKTTTQEHMHKIKPDLDLLGHLAKQ